MFPTILRHALQYLRSLQLSYGGFPYSAGEEARPDTTAWAIISMSAWEFDRESCDRGRAYLASQQATDGRISISPAHPDASWPTPLAIMAWQHFPQFRQGRDRAVQFLLNFAGHHFKKTDNRIMGHDPSIVGWPWIAGTHSWIIPTGLAMTALQQVGLGAHARVIEGQQMLLDRQLSSGGWNYGNTFVFGKELHPLPECTGLALQALADSISIHEIEKSLHYLLQELPHIRTPISLAWALLGLGAWGLKPADTEELALASLRRQERYGLYPVHSLALLLYAVKASHGLPS